jgi:hypothetical protein
MLSSVPGNGQGVCCKRSRNFPPLVGSGIVIGEAELPDIKDRKGYDRRRLPYRHW